MKRHSFFTVLLASLLMLSMSCETRKPYQEAIDRSTTLIDEFMALNHIPGLSVSVAVGDQLVWSRGFGFAELQHQVPVDPATTLFRIGSVSKSYTTAALARLYEEGKIDLDDLVQDYVPEFPWKTDSVSLREIAGHLAGIRHYRGDEFLNNHYYASVHDGLEIFIRDSLLFMPGTRYSYSSYGWNLLSAVIEKASGKDFLTAMDELVFSPLRMDHTFPDYSDSIVPCRTHFYLTDSLDRVIHAPDVDNSYKWAGGGFLSTTEDMVRFAEGNLGGNFILPATLEEWTSTQYTSSGEATHYGIGWATNTNSLGMPWFGHSGGSVGGTTQLLIYPGPGVIVAMAANLSNVFYGDIHHRIACLFMPGKVFPTADTALVNQLSGKYRVEETGNIISLDPVPEGLEFSYEKNRLLLIPRGDSILLSLDGSMNFSIEQTDSLGWYLVQKRGKQVARAVREK